MNDVSQSLDEHRSFVGSYLSDLRDVADSAERLFSIYKWLFIVALGIQVLVLLGTMLAGGFFAIQSIVSLLLLGAATALTVWFWTICVTFARLQKSKIEHDISTNYTIRAENKRSASEILEAAQKRAENMIDASGDNNVILVGSGSISGVSQSKTIASGEDVAQILALIIAYAEESESQEGVKLANEFANEAAKSEPDKGALAVLWAGITAAIPAILGVTKIVTGVKSLF